MIVVFTYGGYDCDPSSDVSSGIGEGYVKLKNSGQTMRSRIAEERVQYKVVKPPNFVSRKIQIMYGNGHSNMK